MRHGTITGYQKHRCRCQPCRAAQSAYMRRRTPPPNVDRKLLGELLRELCPNGLTTPTERARYGEVKA